MLSEYAVSLSILFYYFILFYSVLLWETEEDRGCGRGRVAHKTL